ncbi:MAG: hypothetical protein ACRELD_09805 [Longimicrobiales bacterium]
MSLTSGLLALVSGGLQGQQEGAERARRAEQEEAERKRREEQDEIQRLLAQLQILQTPGVSMPGTEIPAPLEAPPGGIGLAGRPDAAAPQESGGVPTDITQLARHAVETGNAVASGATAEQPAPAELPNPFGGPPIRYTPQPSTYELDAREQERMESQQHAAWEELTRRSPDAYPHFVPGFDFAAELRDVLQSRRTEAADAARFNRGRAADATDRAREQRVQRARTRLVNMLAAGTTLERALAALDTDPELRGLVGFDEAKSLAREAAKPQLQDVKWEERRSGWEQKLGAPRTQLEQDILDALADGENKEEILDELRALPTQEMVESGYVPALPDGRPRITEAAKAALVRDVERYFVLGFSGRTAADHPR